MAKIKYRRKVILAKAEATYGQDATPAAGTNAIQTGNFELDPWEGESVKRELDKATFGDDYPTRLAKHVRARFRVELAGSGTATTAPAWAPVILAAGHEEIAETVAGGDAADQMVYQPIDVNVPSLSFYFYHDTKLHKFLGARGSVVVNNAKRSYPYLQFEFMGLYVPVVDGVLPAPDVSAFVKPVPFRASNVDASLFGQTIGLHSFELTGGQQTGFYETSAEESIELQDRKSNFNILFEEPPAATYDFWADADAETAGILSMVHGTTAGNIVEVRTDHAQIESLALDDQDGIRALRAQGPCVPDAGDPDYQIITR